MSIAGSSAPASGSEHKFSHMPGQDRPEARLARRAVRRWHYSNDVPARRGLAEYPERPQDHRRPDVRSGIGYRG